MSTDARGRREGDIGGKPGVIVRPAVAADSGAMGHLAEEFAAYLRSLGDPAEFQLNAATLLRDGFGDRPAFSALVAEVAGRICAYLLYEWNYDSDCARRRLRVVDLYVDGTARQQGLGRALMAEAARIARAGGARELVWEVLRANTVAAAFYERLGAHRVDEIFVMRINADKLA